MKDIFRTIKTIRISEKAALLTEKNNEYVFEVDTKANKLEIKQAIAQIFGKKVVAVRTMQYDGKERRKRRPDAGITPKWKKAVVRLAEGESMDLA
jgi:large subunit ribosomal protein L23